MKRVPFGKIFAYILAILCTLASLFPLIWIFIFAFLPDRAILSYPPQLIPDSLYLENFKFVYERTNIVRGMGNSLYTVALAVVFVLFFSSFGAYGIARSSPKLRRCIYVILLVTQMVPAMTNMIPIYTIMNKVGLLNTRIGLSIVYTANNLPLAMLLLIGFYLTAVVEVEEAAMIDGCSWFDVFFRISLPMSKPGLVSAVIFTFALSWNEFMMSMLLVTDQKIKTFQVTLYDLLLTQGQYRLQYGVLTAAALLGLLPILLVYGVFQKGFVQGISVGSIK